MERPYIIFHMLTSLDGRITGNFLEEERSPYFIEEYEKIHERYGSTAWMCGRITMEEHFTLGYTLELAHGTHSPIPRTDYVAPTAYTTYAIAIDPSGKLGWTQNFISAWNENRLDDHIIEVLTEQVSDAYLAHLRKIGISYIFGGREQLDFTVVVQKLKHLFSIDKLMLEGGGVLNGAFLREQLIDELSLVIVPITEGKSESLTLFETKPNLGEVMPVNFLLKHVEKLNDGGLLINYVANKD
ncbi:dihydrofolate reductase family protein [Paenibacillus borealis]|uniref:Bacterial bifunctional deaminase-reductase C-terminal domain-containing protein n=1 Tax=Paenibacillus borealis TaxID=160799 RepID=A0A089LBF8_PAEBO|nr:dihydrofolate reductase family protein [Paenibacillus borealis]AIQ58831.1 hypothetical protein PBOR_19270 [Paenibacillus borealis]